MLPLNAYVFKGRGHFLNWGVDFRGGSEILIEFSRPVDAGEVRKTLAAAGFPDADVVKYADPTARSSGTTWCASARFRSSPRRRRSRSRSRSPRWATRRCGGSEWSEGGDKVYLRYDRAVDPSVLQSSLKAIGVNSTQVQTFGRASDKHLRGDAGRPRHRDPARARREAGRGRGVGDPEGRLGRGEGGQSAEGGRRQVAAVRDPADHGLHRLPLRPALRAGTVVALLHDAVLTIGAFAITYKEFSLTTVAAILTIIGFSMNDTIVVFDRIRENAARLRDRALRPGRQPVDQRDAVPDDLTSATVFFVTLAMNVWGVGVIRDFAFAMNVGVIVGTYSSIFIASPILIWLNDKYVTSQRRQQRQPRRPQRDQGDEEPEGL
jgi:preprotein translocase subunit SecF